MEYTLLNDFLDILSEGKNKNIHINITSDMFMSPDLQLSLAYKEHTKPFCTLAKKTRNGYNLCLQCKALSISKAMRYGKSFCGHCPFGMFEYVKPVVYNGKIVCIIYIGNMIVDAKKTIRKLTSSCKVTGADIDSLTEQLKNCDYVEDFSDAEKLANLIDSYIKMLIKNLSIEKYKPTTYSYRTSELKEYIHANYTQNISLRQLAKTYYTNEQYLGRVFKKETGMSVHEYINKIRLSKAAYLLKNSTDSILDISIECGFTNISYFNRSFKNRYKVTPSHYRTQSLDT